MHQNHTLNPIPPSALAHVINHLVSNRAGGTAGVAHHHLETFLARRGQIVSVSWARPMKTLAGVSQIVRKHVSTQARAGVDYENMQSTIAGRANGSLPAVNNGLPWGHWAQIAGQSLFPHVIEHTPKGANTPKLYLRFATLPNTRCVTSYSIGENFAPISELAARELCRASEFARDELTSVFTVSAESIVSIN